MSTPATPRSLARTPGVACTAFRLALVLALVTVAGAGCRETNSSDVPGGAMTTPFASFASQSATSGTPGLAVEFLDTSTGPVATRSWNFGNGQTSTDSNPTVTYATAGLYSVTLTVTGGRGTSSATQTNLVQIESVPTAGFTCSSELGFAPLMTLCTNSGTSTGPTTTFLWDFGDGTTSTLENPNHTYSAPGNYTLTQTITTAGGSASQSLAVQVLPLTISASPGSGSGPGPVTLTADTGGFSGSIEMWTVNGFVAGNGRTIVTPLNTPGTYTIVFTFGNISPFLAATASIDYVVTFGAPVAAFSPSVSEAPGPLSVVMNDESIGDLIQWEWDFGDGTSCDFPNLVSSSVLCNDSSPTHVYDAVGRYDVRLVVTGRGENPGDPNLTSAPALIADAVSVTILDPSFENQVIGDEIAAGWTTLRPASAGATAQHIALSTSEPGGADAGMPTDGNRWAALDGLGTNGSTAVAQTNNGIRTTFLRPADESVLEFDYAFLYSEPTLSGTLDGMTATVSVGATSVEMTSARANIETPNAGGSLRFPTLDGSTTRATAVHTASLDLATAFPAAGPDTLYTLTIRLSNATNTLRSPRAYVDDIRFTDPETPLVADFDVVTDPVVAGRAVSFMDLTCPAPGPPACEVPTSWRWDFDTHLLIAPPATTGSGDQDPTYVFPAAGDYDVTLLARIGDQESLVTKTVSVIGAPVASFTAVFPGTTQAPNAVVQFTDTSSSDPTDPIVAWNWDFVLGGASTQGPHAVTFTQAGSYPIRLTVTTASGLTDTGTVVITVD